VYRLMRMATSLIYTSEIKILPNLPSINYFSTDIR